MASIEQAKAVLNKYRSQIIGLPYVSSVSVSTIGSEAVIMVLLNRKPEPSEWMPAYIEQVPVRTKVVGVFQSF